MLSIFQKTKVLILTVFVLFSSTYLFAGITGKIVGTVTDAETGDKLPGVNIILEGTDLGSASNQNGYYAILNVPPGNYTLNASMIGYKEVTVTNVVVRMDLTTRVDVELATEALQMEDVVVVAERPVVVKDISASQLNLQADKIEAMPLKEITDVLELQAGIENGLQIRGGAARQTAYIVDGFIQNDERSNDPYTTVSLSSVEEVKVQTGGFNAEYGNVRSGVVNVITKDGPKDYYNGSVSVNYRAPGPKHFGISPYDENSFFLRPFLDPEVAYSGTGNGAWDLHTQEQYPDFAGWNFISEQRLQDADPTNDLTPEGARRLFLWQHRRNGEIYKPDYVMDIGLGGPVPFISDQLGNLRFYGSFRDLQEMFIIPLSRDSYAENMSQLKLVSDITNETKLTLMAKYGETHSASPYNWTTTPTGDVLRSDYSIANLITSEMLFMPGWYSPTAIYRTILGGKVNQVLSSTSYFEVNLQHTINRYNTHRISMRDTTDKYEILPGYFTDETPYGYWGYGVGSIGDNIRLGGWMNLGRDKSVISTTQFRTDYVNQFNQNNELKTGLEIIYNNYDIKSYTSNPGMETWNREQVYQVQPYRIGAYIQDKLEFEGFIANVGIRLDYTDSNTEYYRLSPYDELYKEGNGDQLEEQAPANESEDHWAFSPRLGVSHPITENSKLYFNYGHFLTEPASTYRFRIQREYNGLVTSIGNPNLQHEKTVSYEIGYSHDLFDRILLNIAAYYKDVTNQIGWVNYQNINGTVDYSIPDNNNYADIRGFEITVDKRVGDWVTGFVNYTYMVRTTGYFGLRYHYEDPNLQREYLMENPYQEKPHPQPYIRANLDLHSPQNFGPKYGSFRPLANWSANVLATWRAGSYTTYNPNNELGKGIVNNVQWKDQYNVDLRLAKTMRQENYTVQVFMDVSNLFNFKYLSYTGFASGRDYDNYMKSLNFSWEEGVEHGNDRIGEYRDWDVEYDPLEQNPNNDPEIAKRNKERKETNSYIDMPNIRSMTFLNPRDIEFGIKITF